MTRWIRYLGLAVIAACAAAPEPSPPPTASPLMPCHRAGSILSWSTITMPREAQDAHH